jgi:hypothetical protein
VGVSAGAAINDIVGDETDELDSRTTPYFGLVLVTQPASLVGFETGLHYVSKGASLEDDDDDVEADIKLTYVEIPLLLRLAFSGTSSGMRPVLKAGGYVAFQSSCDVEGEAGGISVEIDCDEFLEAIGAGDESDFESFDFGLKGGAALDIPVGQRAVIAPEITYTRGLRDILEIDGESQDGKNSTIQIGVSVRLRI